MCVQYRSFQKDYGSQDRKKIPSPDLKVLSSCKSPEFGQNKQIKAFLATSDLRSLTTVQSPGSPVVKYDGTIYKQVMVVVVFKVVVLSGGVRCTGICSIQYSIYWSKKVLFGQKCILFLFPRFS